MTEIEASIWKGKLDNLNNFYEELKTKECFSCEVASRIINELLGYVVQYCDAEDVLTSADKIAKDYFGAENG